MAAVTWLPPVLPGKPCRSPQTVSGQGGWRTDSDFGGVQLDFELTSARLIFSNSLLFLYYVGEFLEIKVSKRFHTSYDLLVLYFFLLFSSLTFDLSACSHHPLQQCYTAVNNSLK